MLIKKRNTTLFYIFITIANYPLLLSQPIPLGPGNSGGIGGHGQKLVAPVGNFLWGLILFSILYLFLQMAKNTKRSKCLKRPIISQSLLTSLHLFYFLVSNLTLTFKISKPQSHSSLKKHQIAPKIPYINKLLNSLAN